MDFIAVNQRVTIPAGSTHMPVIIPIVDDRIYEITKSFTVLIEKIGRVTPTGVSIETPNPTMVEITDNDG